MRRDKTAQYRGYLIAALGGMACLVSLPSAVSPAAAEPATEQQAFNNACRTCHVTREGDNRLGPNLHKIVGRKAGSLPNYGYSSALKEADFVWDEAKLDRFIANPDEVVAGNKMKPYSGLTNKEDREKIVAFLAKAQ